MQDLVNYNLDVHRFLYHKTESTFFLYRVTTAVEDFRIFFISCITPLINTQCTTHNDGGAREREGCSEGQSSGSWFGLVHLFGLIA